MKILNGTKAVLHTVRNIKCSILDDKRGSYISYRSTNDIANRQSHDYCELIPTNLRRSLQSILGSYVITDFLPGLDAVDCSKTIEKYAWKVASLTGRTCIVKYMIVSPSIYGLEMLLEPLSEISHHIRKMEFVKWRLDILPDGKYYLWQLRDWNDGIEYEKILASPNILTEKQHHAIALGISKSLNQLHFLKVDFTVGAEIALCASLFLSKPTGLLDVINHYVGTPHGESLLQIRNEQLVRWHEVLSGSPMANTVHGDLHPGNIIIQNYSEVIFIDWECGTIGFYEDDISAILANYFIMSMNDNTAVLAGELIDILCEAYEFEMISRNTFVLTLGYRLLCTASPIWYPKMPNRKSVMHLATALLEDIGIPIHIDEIIKLLKLTTTDNSYIIRQ